MTIFRIMWMAAKMAAVAGAVFISFSFIAWSCFLFLIWVWPIPELNLDAYKLCMIIGFLAAIISQIIILYILDTHRSHN